MMFLTILGVIFAVTLLSTPKLSSAFVSSPLDRQEITQNLKRGIFNKRRIRYQTVLHSTTSASDHENQDHPFDKNGHIPSPVPRHVAFICDGNQRWAKRRHFPTSLGHKKGADRLVELITHFAAATETDDNHNHCIEHVTLYGFSTENWKRNSREIKEIFQVMEMTARSLLRQPSNTKKRQRPIQVRIVGDLDDERIPHGARQALRELETATAKSVMEHYRSSSSNNNNNKKLSTLTVNLAINYGGRQDIVRACQFLANQVAEGLLSPQDITADLLAKQLYTANLPDPDMIIRTSGECRLSNFLLWDCAYTELYMTDTLWPDFDIDCWNQAAEWYSGRQRRFGARSNENDAELDDQKIVEIATAATIPQLPHLRDVSANSNSTVIEPSHHS